MIKNICKKVGIFILQALEFMLKMFCLLMIIDELHALLLSNKDCLLGRAFESNVFIAILFIILLLMPIIWIFQPIIQYIFKKIFKVENIKDLKKINITLWIIRIISILFSTVFFVVVVNLFYTNVIKELEKQYNCNNIIELINKAKIKTWNWDDKSVLQAKYNKGKVVYILKIPAKKYKSYYYTSNVEITFSDDSKFLIRKEIVKLKDFANYEGFYEYSSMFAVSKDDYKKIQKASYWVR